MTEAEKLRAIAALIRSGRGGFPLPSEQVAQAFGLTTDRWSVTRYAGCRQVLCSTLAAYLDGLAQCRGNESVQVVLAQLVGVDQSLADQAEQLRAAVCGERLVVGQGIKDIPGGVDVV